MYSTQSLLYRLLIHFILEPFFLAVPLSGLLVKLSVSHFSFSFLAEDIVLTVIHNPEVCRFSLILTVISETQDDLSESPSTRCAPTSEQQEECRAVIEQIRREDFGIGLELGEEESKLVQRQREREGRGLHRLSTELYTRDTHFVLELVQNADDNSYPEVCSDPGFPSLEFVLERDKIVILNNEVGFVENNIRALCDVGRSTKGAHRYGYIGLYIHGLFA